MCNQQLRRAAGKRVCYNFVAMFDLFRLWLGAMFRGFRTRRSLMLENLALRQQLAVFKRQQPRPRLGSVKINQTVRGLFKGPPQNRLGIPI